jgi:hypothetical protein
MQCSTCLKDLSDVDKFIYHKRRLFCDSLCFDFDPNTHYGDFFIFINKIHISNELHPLFEKYKDKTHIISGRCCRRCKHSIYWDTDPICEIDIAERFISTTFVCRFCYTGQNNPKMDRYMEEYDMSQDQVDKPKTWLDTMNYYLSLSFPAEEPKKLPLFVKRLKDMSLKDYIDSWDSFPILDLGGRTGSTDYLDFITVEDMENLPIRVGVDRFNRPFIALRIIHKKEEEPFVVCVFQRYTNDKITWSTGSCYGDRNFTPVHGNSGHITPVHYAEYIDFIEDGENTHFILTPFPYYSITATIVDLLTSQEINDNQIDALNKFEQSRIIKRFRRQST